ncbi:hypothetical protein [Streptomyces flaveolus]|uniref:Transcriptional regulator n=1 Tax=Streptomyces flaveolus TaxID=67297 RepID=A0ABV3A7U4_9ACTN
MSRLGDFARSLKPGNDQHLAENLSTKRRAAHRRSVGKAAAKGQGWEDKDRDAERAGGWRLTDWGRS